MSTNSGRVGMVGAVGGVALLAITLSATTGLAQTAGGTPSGTTTAAAAPRQSSGDPRRDTLMRMQTPVTIDLNDTPLEDAIKYVIEVTRADIEPLWTTDNESEGLSKETSVTLSAKGMPALMFLEKLTAQLEGGTAKYSWQMDEDGTLQFGPKSRLNRFKRVEIYDINDLLFILPVYDNAPQIDLQQVLQQAGRGGGGGGQSPFRDNQNRNRRQDQEPPTKEERARKVQDIITQIIDPEEWQAGGGEGGSIIYHEGTLIVNAADYLHRQVNGYRWWPTFRASTASAGRRYVQLNIDTSISQLQRPIRSVPTSAVVGGQVITSPGGGG